MIGLLDACVAIIAYDWGAIMKEVTADLMKASCMWSGFDEC